MAFARLFPIDATDTPDGNRIFFETLIIERHVLQQPARTDDGGYLPLLGRSDALRAHTIHPRSLTGRAIIEVDGQAPAFHSALVGSAPGVWKP
jgi:hypothetical protein